MSKLEKNSSASLYAKREKIYPREIHGVFAFWRASGVFVLLGLFYIMPWVQWSGRQAVLFDLPNRKFYIFDLVLWPQDFIYLALLLIIAAVSLFFFTAIAGRLWCGFACPQTVWTEVFLWIERKIEGSRNQQIKLDQQKLTPKKFALKSTKHAVWIIFSLFTGYTFVGYFTPIQELGVNLVNYSLGPWETFWVFFYGFATYGNAGWMREQVCIYMCPYARFQSAMFDNDTLIIAYDKERGEPRGARRRGTPLQKDSLGACIDCKMCVQVCPTGIDIRKGLQYQCIACGCCIDVCNDVMTKMGYPKNLIQYSTENKSKGHKAKILRPKIIVYSVILTILLTIFIYSLSHRQSVELDVFRDRKVLYRETNEGMIENIYTIKILNKNEKAQRFRIFITGLNNKAKLNVKEPIVTVPAGEILAIPASIIIDPADVKPGGTTVTFKIVSVDSSEIHTLQDSRFIAPR